MMNKSQLEKKLGVEVLSIPSTYLEDDTTKINIKLPCGHEKLTAVKTLMKGTPKCLVCNPRKIREQKVVDIDHAGKCVLEECCKIIDRDDKDFLKLLLQRLIENDEEGCVKIFGLVKKEIVIKNR